MIEYSIKETDVLVVGGGIAGAFAAIKAKEQGARVTLVDKGRMGKSGLSSWFGTFAVCDESQGATREVWTQSFLLATEFMTNMDYVQLFLDESKARWDEMVKWGAVNNSKNGGCAVALREAAEKAGVDIIDRTMITDLLKKDGKVVGAIGFPLEDEQAFIIKANAVVLCTGAGSFKAPGWPIAPNTFDGHMMAYRAGAQIAGKEGNDFHGTNTVYPYSTVLNCGDKFAEDIRLVLSPHGHGKNQIFRDGRNGIITKATLKDVTGLYSIPEGPPPGEQGGPPPRQVNGPPRSGEVVGAVCGGSEHRCDGVFPQDENCFSGVEGLYAAGDALCTGGVGLLGSAAPGCAVQGAKAGTIAAVYAEKANNYLLSDKELESEIVKVFEPLNRKIGYSGDYVIQLVQSIMSPYYVLYVKEESRMKAALINIEYLRDHFVPRLAANDMHELRTAHEAKNIVYTAEMKLRASLFRTESRGSHYREDIPVRDDENWLAWTIISKSGDEMIVSKRSVEGLPDYDMTYEQRYTDVYPGEKDYLKNIAELTS